MNLLNWRVSGVLPLKSKLLICNYMDSDQEKQLRRREVNRKSQARFYENHKDEDAFLIARRKAVAQWKKLNRERYNEYCRLQYHQRKNLKQNSLVIGK